MSGKSGRKEQGQILIVEQKNDKKVAGGSLKVIQSVKSKTDALEYQG